MKKHEVVFLGIAVLCSAIIFTFIGISLFSQNQPHADGQVDSVPKLVSTMKIAGNTVDYFDNDMAAVEFDFTISRSVVIETIAEMERYHYYPYAEVWRQYGSSNGYSIMVFKKSG